MLPVSIAVIGTCENLNNSELTGCVRDARELNVRSSISSWLGGSLTKRMRRSAMAEMRNHATFVRLMATLGGKRH